MLTNEKAQNAWNALDGDLQAELFTLDSQLYMLEKTALAASDNCEEIEPDQFSLFIEDYRKRYKKMIGQLQEMLEGMPVAAV